MRQVPPQKRKAGVENAELPLFDALEGQKIMYAYEKMLLPDYVPPKRNKGGQSQKVGSKRKGAPKTQKVGAKRKGGGQTQQGGSNAKVPRRRKDPLYYKKRHERENYGFRTQKGYLYVPLPPPDMEDIQARLDFEWELNNDQIVRQYSMFDSEAFNSVLKDRGYTPKWGDVMLAKVLDVTPKTVHNRRSDGNWGYWQIILVADVLKMTPLEFLNCFFSGCFYQDEKGNTYVKCNSEDIKRCHSYTARVRKRSETV